ncbi:AMP-binding protein [Kitasatospora sp. NPDC058444]|uniref:AMP-binding protein n=1 Tax=Kitasatospora sp. NPDC058444 TaxID=3346504 RepID=UPI0036657E55
MDASIPSAHVDTFARDHLPPVEEWPEILVDLPELRYPRRLNCAAELLDGTIGRFGGDRPCLLDQAGTVWSYGQVAELVNRTAEELVHGYGLRPGNRVLLRGPNSPWLAICWLAVMKAGGVAVTTMALLRAVELREVIAKAEVRFALCDERFTEELELASGDDLTVIRYDVHDGGELGRRAKARTGVFPAVRTAADDVALIAFTSGTSGVPKATVHFHRDVLAIADTFSARVLRPEPTDLFAGSPPLGFTYGLGGLLIFPLRAGAASLLLEETAPDKLFRAVARHRVSVLFTSPTAYRRVLDALDDYDLASLRLCVSAGEALSLATWQAFERATGLRLVDGIGSTEMLHVFISAAGEDIRPGATGRVVPGFRARVVDESGAEVPDGVPGLLQLKGPTGCRYLADPRQRAQVRDGWTFTGDVFIKDADGYFWYQARSDDMIVSSGYNIAAPEVENSLLRHPAVAECAVVGAPDPGRGEIVKAYVVLAADYRPGEELAAALQSFVKSDIAPYKYPRAIEFTADLPRGNTGKLLRSALRESSGSRSR